eukprot:TRINITY_DN27618_c0_g1_i2.p1 TRINITY_DN27618_c0_g1~~TRINITY_DN27618_c0_g1_i2.p1  ORF type:complete len:284 (+),score=72.51 TRINITY_DN27618_c0_g1_i2:233-1084(+)
MLAQIEQGERNDEGMQQLLSIPLLSTSLPDLQRLRQNTDEVVHKSEALLKRADKLGTREFLKQLRMRAAGQVPVVELLVKLANSSADGSLQLMEASQLEVVIRDCVEQIASDQANRPDPADLAGLHELAAQTRAEAERQRQMATELITVAGPASDYEGSALTHAVHVLEAALHQSSEQLQRLEQQQKGFQESMPHSVAESVEACEEASRAGRSALDSMGELAEKHQAGMRKLWDQIHAARASVARPARSNQDVSRSDQASQAISGALKMATRPMQPSVGKTGQ